MFKALALIGCVGCVGWARPVVRVLIADTALAGLTHPTMNYKYTKFDLICNQNNRSSPNASSGNGDA
jgi:hypothetical protein